MNQKEKEEALMSMIHSRIGIGATNSPDKTQLNLSKIKALISGD